jgi:hypothetical protein
VLLVHKNPLIIPNNPKGWNLPFFSGENADVDPVVERPPGPFEELYDPLLGYKFKYPTVTASGKPLRMVLARTPEKYSSAAPLTADARQRIVAELIDVRNFVSVTVSVGPAAGVLKNGTPATWVPKDVALTVLIDR